MEFSDAVQVLRGTPIFSRLDPARLKLIAFASQYLTFEDGEALFHAGDPSDGVYLIDEGEVGILADKDGHAVTVAVLGRHDLFGEMAILRNAPRVATVRARGRTRVLRINSDMFLGMVTEDPDVALAVMRILCDKVANTLESFEKLSEKVRRSQSIGEMPDSEPV
jgi:CRP/FNR family transcriptional regulator, cyclic AMP receptor protein